jgi:hypothetical protein
MQRITLTLISVAFFVGIPSRHAAATSVDVFPGAGTLQAAIDGASDGTTIRMHPGTYTGAVTVDKRVRLRSYPDVPPGGDVVIDGNCAAPVALDIAADGVQLKVGTLHGFYDTIEVVRGTATQIRIANHSDVQLKGGGAAGGVILVDPSRHPLCGTEQDGIEVSGNSFHVKIARVGVGANPGVGFRFSGLPLGANVKLQRGSADVNNIGVLVENSANGAALARAGIVLKDMSILQDTAAGIRLVNSDGVAIRSNGLTGGSGSGLVGIDIDANSNRNLIQSNTWADGGTNTPFVDNGTGNCGSGNNFAVPPCP